MKKILRCAAFAAIALLCAAPALAGQAVIFFDYPADAVGAELAIGSCNGAGDGYGLDVAREDGQKRKYIRLDRAPDTIGEELRINELEQGETFCFRVRPFNAAGVRGSWHFLGSKRIPLDSTAQPPLLPLPGEISNGRVQ